MTSPLSSLVQTEGVLVIFLSVGPRSEMRDGEKSEQAAVDITSLSYL